MDCGVHLGCMSVDWDPLIEATQVERKWKMKWKLGLSVYKYSVSVMYRVAAKELKISSHSIDI